MTTVNIQKMTAVNRSAMNIVGETLCFVFGFNDQHSGIFSGSRKKMVETVSGSPIFLTCGQDTSLPDCRGCWYQERWPGVSRSSSLSRDKNRSKFYTRCRHLKTPALLYPVQTLPIVITHRLDLVQEPAAGLSVSRAHRQEWVFSESSPLPAPGHRGVLSLFLRGRLN